MGVLKKIQSLPRKNRKIILWVAVVVIGAGLLTWWIGNLEKRWKTFQPEEFIGELNIPAFEKEIEKLPEFKIPEMGEIVQELKKLEQAIKQEVDEKEQPSKIDQ